MRYLLIALIFGIMVPMIVMEAGVQSMSTEYYGVRRIPNKKLILIIFWIMKRNNYICNRKRNFFKTNIHLFKGLPIANMITENQIMKCKIPSGLIRLYFLGTLECGACHLL